SRVVGLIRLRLRSRQAAPMRSEQRPPADFSWISLFLPSHRPRPDSTRFCAEFPALHVPSITFFLDRHGPCERLRDSRSPDPQGLQPRLEILALGRGLDGAAQPPAPRLRP